MFRFALAAMATVAALALGSCGPSVKVDPANPWATLLPWNHNVSGVQKLPSGVEYIVIRKGDGKQASPGPTDRVEVMYEGKLAAQGITFDSSYERKAPETFAVNGVIPGWTEGLQKMQPGDMFMFWIPADKGYGDRGSPSGEIPPGADLMFQVELQKVFPDPWKQVTPWPTDSSAVIRRPSGLEYLVIESGPADGASPTDNDVADINFEGRLESVGKEEGETAEDLRKRSVVVTTLETGRPAPFPVAGVVPGWNELLKLMRKGDRWMVRMPASLLYADEGDGRIPPGATVIYEVQLADFGPVSPVPATPAPQ